MAEKLLASFCGRPCEQARDWVSASSSWHCTGRISKLRPFCQQQWQNAEKWCRRKVKFNNKWLVGTTCISETQHCFEIYSMPCFDFSGDAVGCAECARLIAKIQQLKAAIKKGGGEFWCFCFGVQSLHWGFNLSHFLLCSWTFRTATIILMSLFSALNVVWRGLFHGGWGVAVPESITDAIRGKACSLNHFQPHVIAKKSLSSHSLGRSKRGWRWLKSPGTLKDQRPNGPGGLGKNAEV